MKSIKSSKMKWTSNFLLVVCGLNGVIKADDETFVYYNQYAATNNNVKDCGFGKPQSYMFVHQLQANVCTSIKMGKFAETKYVQVQFDPVSNKPNLFLDQCDSACTSGSCVDEIEIEPMKCYANTEGSVAFYAHYCAGSDVLDRYDGIATFAYTSNDCTIEDGNGGHNAYVRNYDKSFTRGCEYDFTIGDNTYYYSLNYTEVNGTTYFSGGSECNKDCSSCDYEFDDLLEGECQKGKSGSFSVERSDKLDTCKPNPPGPPNAGPTPPPAFDPDFGNDVNDPTLIASLVGGGIGLSMVVFGVALAYRRYEFRNRQAQNVPYASVSNTQYGTANYDEEGMTTDI